RCLAAGQWWPAIGLGRAGARLVGADAALAFVPRASTTSSPFSPVATPKASQGPCPPTVDRAADAIADAGRRPSARARLQVTQQPDQDSDDGDDDEEFDECEPSPKSGETKPWHRRLLWPMGMKMAMEKEEIRPWDEWEGRRHPPWMCVPRFPMGESSNSFLTLFSSVKKI